MQVPRIIFEDKDMIVLDKPSGMTVNNSDTARGEETVQGWIEKNFQKTQKAGKSDNQGMSSVEVSDYAGARSFPGTPGKVYNIEEEFYNRGGIVHRLDKETSGILLVAKNPESFGKLKQQFMSRTVKKTYTALAHGKIIPEKGEINAPVGRLPFNRTHFGVVAGGREALTYYSVISNYQFSISKKNIEVLTLSELYPQTGRTHQIRVHLKYLGHPIFSDELYAGRKTAREDRKYLPRLFLHASKISFNHPSTGKSIKIEIPLPQDLQTFLSNLALID